MSFPPLGDLPNPEIELMSPAAPALAGGFFHLGSLKWIKKMLYKSTMAYYLVMKNNEVKPRAASWVDLEIIILSELS